MGHPVDRETVPIPSYPPTIETVSEYLDREQAGTVLGQAQLKLELELYFTSFKICCIKLIKLVKLC